MQVRSDLEEVLRTALSAVQKGGDGLTATLEKLAVPVYVTDTQGLLTHYNQACVTFTGRTPRIGEDRWCVTWELYHEEGHALTHASCPMVTAIRERRAVRGIMAIALRPDGTRVRFRPWPTPVFDGRGRLIGAVNMMVEAKAGKKAPPSDAAVSIEPVKTALDVRAEQIERLRGTDNGQDADRWYKLRIARADVGNDLLRSLAGDCPDVLSGFERVSLAAGSHLVWANKPIQQVYFLESGLASVVMQAGQKRAEVAMFGSDGIAGHCIALGTDRSPRSTLMQVDGVALQISVRDLRHKMEETPLLLERLPLFVNDVSNQITETACATAFLTVEARLARWLIMATDRIGPELPLTHDAIADLLGSRRASVTIALHQLEGGKAIQSHRSKIVVTDRGKLLDLLAHKRFPTDSKLVA